MSVRQFLRDWTAYVREGPSSSALSVLEFPESKAAKVLREGTLVKLLSESKPNYPEALPDHGPDVMSEVHSKLVADWVARHGLVKNAQLVFQKISGYTLTKKGTICFWDEDGKPVTCTVKSRNTSRRNLHKRARRHIGRAFVSMAFQPHTPLEVVNVSMDVSFTFDNKHEMEETK